MKRRWQSSPRPATPHSHICLYYFNPQRSKVDEPIASTTQRLVPLSGRNLITQISLRNSVSFPSEPQQAISFKSYYAQCPRDQINPIFNTTGMTGWVCGVPARPGTLDISRCCTGQ
jgi:hypothetical protein